MVKRSSLDPLEEARARVRLRYAKTRPVDPGPAKIGHAALKLARKRLPKSGSTLDHLKDQWGDLVGPQLSKLCRPEKIASVKGGRQLTLKVVPAAAGLVQHQSEMIRQRVSVAAGGDILKIKIIQGQIGSQPSVNKASPIRPLNSAEKRDLEEALKSIDDKGLRAALTALGEAILTAPSD